jgi:predicted Zn-dependent protease with MMP-like domain
MDEQEWNSLSGRAEKIIEQVLQAMPEELRREAERVPCLLEPLPPEGDDALGRCLSFEENYISQAPGPIVLYLGTIQEECRELGLDFDDEVRITFLHELGHHLGLDEADLEDRGLL